MGYSSGIFCPRNLRYFPAVHTCEYCGEEIAFGDEYVDFGNGYFHLDCVDDMTTKELLQRLKVEVKTVGEGYGTGL